MLNRVFFLSGFFFFLQSISFAQTPRNLVFEGAGIRGIAYCGALRKMEEKNWLQPVLRVGGTSAGAVTAMVVALGYDSREIQQIITGTSFKKLSGGPFSFLGGINRISRYFGWYKTQRVDEWLGRIIAAKTGNPDITFRELKEKGFKDLYVTGTSLNQQQLVVFSYENYPDMKVRYAVRISMGIPFYFEAAFIDNLGRPIQHPKNKSGLNVMVDGGITGNFPIRLFDSTKYINGDPGLNQFQVNKETIGLRIDSDDQIDKDSRRESGLAMLPVNSVKEYTAALYNFVIENLNRQSLTIEDWSRTISISSSHISPRLRKMKKTEIELLITNGMKGFDNFSSK